MSECAECGIKFDMEEGGYLWLGSAFCEIHDPERPEQYLCGDHLTSIGECGCKI